MNLRNSLPSPAAAFAALAFSASLASAQTILPANPGPANNGGSTSWAIFFDVTATTPGVVVTEMTTANTGAAGAAFSVEVLTYVGSCLGGPVAAGPGSSLTGWTSLGSVPATQGPVASAISLPIDIPDIALTVGQVTGVAVRFTTVGPRYFGTGAPAYSVYSDSNMSLTTGDSRSAPFTPTGSFFTSRALVGSLTYTNGGPAPVVYCTAKLTSNGCTPSIGYSGTASATAGSGFLVNGTNFINNKNCLLFYGVSGQGALPFQGGLLCVGTPIKRTLGTNTFGNPPPNDCSGVPSIDMNAFAVSAGPPLPLPALSVPGTLVNCQWWGRDPGFVAPDNTQLSDGLEYTVGP